MACITNTNTNVTPTPADVERLMGVVLELAEAKATLWFARHDMGVAKFSVPCRSNGDLAIQVEVKLVQRPI